MKTILARLAFANDIAAVRATTSNYDDRHRSATVPNDDLVIESCNYDALNRHVTATASGHDSTFFYLAAGGQAIEEPVDEIAVRIAANPINRTDPSGEKWKYVPNMGTFSMEMGPNPDRAVTDPSSNITISFLPKKSAFNKTSPTCTKIRFIQIYQFTHDYWKAKYIGGHTTQGVWHLDADAKEAPWYPERMTPITGNPQMAAITGMGDSPEFGTIGSATYFTQKYETVAVSADKGSPTYGEVYGAVFWYHQFAFKGGNVTQVARDVLAAGHEVYSVGAPSATVTARIASADGFAPSAEMSAELNKWFP
jgi:hypothetical protein